MKFKTTQKAIKANYNTIICVPYCGLQNLLNYESPVAYTERREGWAADIYDMGYCGYNPRTNRHFYIFVSMLRNAEIFKLQEVLQ